MRRFFLRLLNLVRRDRAERELTREIDAHLTLLEDEFQRRGMTPGDARRAARIALGGIEQTKELQRDERSFAWLEDARRDVEYGARVIRRNPAFATTAAMSLAIGIGANSAVFTVANALLFRDPPGVADAGRLVDIGASRGDGGLNPTSYPNFMDIRRRTTTLSGVYAHQMFPQAMSLETSGAGAERVFGHFVTTTYFTVLGVTSLAGRLFDASDPEQPGASPVIVLSYGFWNSRFGRDPAAIGRNVRLNGETFTIVGVTPQGFQGNGIVAPDVWIPLNMAPNAASFPTASRGGGWLIVGGRLKADVSLTQAADEVDAIGQALNREYPSTGSMPGLRLLESSRTPGNRGLIGRFVAVLMIIVALVLAVACANVAGLLLARAMARQHEMAVRMAIGAGRGRLVRQLMTETMLLFAVGGAAGLFLGRLLLSLLVPLLPSLPFPIVVPLALDARVVAFTTAVSFGAALLFGLAPALRTAQADVVTALKDDSHVSAGRSRLRTAFVISQVAFSLVLVVTAGLFVTALQRAGSTNPGFDPRGVELVSLDLSMGRYTDTSSTRFWRQLLERVRQLPSVEAATIARVFPGGFEGIGIGGITIPGAPGGDATPSYEHSWNIVEPGYFDTLRIPLLAGRDFNVSDTASTPPVAIVGEAVARRFWPDGSALGKSISYGIGGRGRNAQIIGVVGDVRSSSVIDGLAGSFIYLPLQQQSAADMTSTMTIAARRSSGQHPITDIRALIRSMDPNLAIVSSGTLDDSTALGLAPQRIVVSFAGTLGLVGLLLASIGIYGITAYSVARRSREIGIRLALGARSVDVMGMVLRQGLFLTVIGSAIGLALAAAVSQVLTAFLFGVPPLHPPTFLFAAGVFGAVGLTACYLPARRAAAVDPSSTLRRE